MELNFIGIGGAFNTELGSNSAYIKENDKILFLDFGLDTFSKVVKYRLVNKIDEIYVLITHLHGDHVGGLPTFIQYCYLCFNKRVKLINNSDAFKSELVKLLKITGVEETNYEFINLDDLKFEFKVSLKKTIHTPLLECYSVIFTDEKDRKILYTSDSKDIEFVTKAINDEKFSKIYTEVGEHPNVHMEYDELKKLDKDKLVMMHIESETLYEKILEDGYQVPNYLK